MKKTMNFASALVLALVMVLAIWPIGHPYAALRCYPTNRFVVLAGGLVSDTLTNLVWQQQASRTTMSRRVGSARVSNR